MDIFINSFDGPNLRDGTWAEVLRFSNTTDANNSDNNHRNLGSRIPAVFTHKDGYIIVPTQIGDNNNYYMGCKIYLAGKTWYKLEITQLSENSKVCTCLV